MTERAAHLVDAVLPRVPVRQWVLTLPYRLRYKMAWNHGLSRAVLRVYTRPPVRAPGAGRSLMHRAFGIDVLACAHCVGRLRLIATLHDPAVIRKILAPHALGHSGQSPGPAPPESGAAAS
jgi:hypothetical protein